MSIPHEIAARYLVDDVSLLQGWREYLNMSQQTLADRLEVSQSQIAQWERPEARPSQTTQKKIALALGVHVRQLRLE